jgi:hypothetical protein
MRGKTGAAGADDAQLNLFFIVSAQNSSGKNVR